MNLGKATMPLLVVVRFVVVILSACNGDDGDPLAKMPAATEREADYIRSCLGIPTKTSKPQETWWCTPEYAQIRLEYDGLPEDPGPALESACGYLRNHGYDERATIAALEKDGKDLEKNVVNSIGGFVYDMIHSVPLSHGVIAEALPWLQWWTPIQQGGPRELLDLAFAVRTQQFNKMLCEGP